MKKASSASNKIRSIVQALLPWFAGHARDLPWRRTTDPYRVFVSEVMLQQTQVKTVIPYWERWMEHLPDASALAGASEDRVLKLWEGLGYYSRARNLHRAAKVIRNRPGGQFPQTYEDVLALPGVGRYTAGAICSIAYNHPTPVLDGNVIRVLTRIFGLSGDPREKKTNARLWQLAEAAVRFAATIAPPRLPFPSTGSCSVVNQALMELGAIVCTPKQPRCPACPVRDLCRARATNSVDRLPNLSKRAAITQRQFVAFALEHRGRWLVQQRPANAVNGGLWEFPAFEIDPGRLSFDPSAVLQRELLQKAPPLTPLPSIRHSITRYRITVHPFTARLNTRHLQPRPNSDERPPSTERPGPNWKTADELEALALTSAHRKLWHHLRTRGSAP